MKSNVRIRSAPAAEMLPLDYLLSVINDPQVDPGRRDRLAIITLPYCHPKLTQDRLRLREVRQRAARKALTSGPWADILRSSAETKGD
jgi:hypothetical protein